MQLREWLGRQDLNAGAFARQIGAADARTVQRYLTGERIPTLDMMRRITAQTGGAVTANDFYYEVKNEQI